MKTESYLRIRPVKGKYVETEYNGIKYSIYLLDPRTNEAGTLVPRNVGLALLSLPSPIVALVPQKDSNNNFVTQLTSAEQTQLAERMNNASLGINYEAESEEDDSSEELDATKKELAETKAKAEKETKAATEELAKLKAELTKTKSALTKATKA